MILRHKHKRESVTRRQQSETKKGRN